MSKSTGPACGNNPNFQMSDADRKVVEDFKAFLADRAVLRDRIASEMAKRDGHSWPTEFEDDERDYRRRADAALAVLHRATQPEFKAAAFSASIDRAAVLHEAAVAAASGDVEFNTEAIDAAAANAGPFALVAYVQLAVSEHLRRLAAEAQQPDTETPTDLSWPRRAWDLGLLHQGGDPHRCPACLAQPEPPADFMCPGAEANAVVLANPQPADVARQDGAQPC